MKNALFIESRAKASSRPITKGPIADCEIRCYPNLSNTAIANSVSVQVVNRDKTRREKELVFIQFTDGSQWSGTFDDLQQVLRPSYRPMETGAWNKDFRKEHGGRPVSFDLEGNAFDSITRRGLGFKVTRDIDL